MSVFCSHMLPIAMLLYGVAAAHRFAIQPGDFVTVEGTSFQLLCKVNVTAVGGQHDTLHWQFNGTQFACEIEEDFDRGNSSFTCTLTIMNVIRQEEGLYRCVLHGKLGINIKSSDSAQITILSTPRFLQEPKNVSAIEGFGITLRCKLDNIDSNAMFVTWMKDNVTVAISDVRDATMEKNGLDVRYSITGDKVKAYHLQIRTVQKSDAGTFYCSVHLNISGKVILQSPGAKLDVLYPPDEDSPSCIPVESRRYLSGDTLTTECISRGGNGPLRLSWVRNGEEINGTRINERFSDIKDEWILTSADNGASITCVMNGKAVLNGRHCEIGPLNVYVKATTTSDSIKPETDQASVGHSVTFKKSTVPTLTTASPPMQTGLSSAVISLIVTISIFLFAVIILAALIFRYHNIKKTKSYGLSRFHSSPPQHELETVN